MDTIYEAAERGDLAEVDRMLTEEPKFLNQPGTGGWTALFWAAAGGHADVVRFLLSRGADPHLSDDHGHRAFYWAAHYHNDAEVTRILLAEHAKWLKSAPTVAEFAAEREKTVEAVHTAVREGDISTLIDLFQSDPELVNCKDASGSTLWSIVAKEGNAAMRKYLRSKGADTSVRSAAQQAGWDAKLAEDRKRVADFVRDSDTTRPKSSERL